MITKENIEELLTVLKFTKDLSSTFWRRDFPIGCTLEVDVRGEKFCYHKAGITVTGATTANFSQNENFVVFECICRILEKGYRPKDIELEPTWRLGRTDKGGRADIWIRTKGKRGESDSVLIIECKTAGKEFDGAWRDTLEDGAQLFSYFKQETSTKFLCLYASDLTETGDIVSDYRLVRVEDNPDYIKTLKKPKTFATAKNGNAKDLFAVWRDTYKLDFATKGLFESDIAPYKPGKTKYSAADLVEIDHVSMQKKYHEFATILRQHNVSGHENAFDKLVNLFLAKVVDEKKNPTDLKFYWKGIAYDDAFSLQDRLQYLYMVGMKDFLGETVTYIDEAQVKKAFGRFERDPDATKDAILKYFRELKFYTNNDFSFIDVHNPRLFRQNFAVLLAIVKMLEDIRLKTDRPNQFLGDLFEGFLDRGVKQSEGQFFTPLPIVRFIVSALPLQQLVNDASEPPRVIDYACGAGHFLNEYAQQIKKILGWYESDSAKAYYSTIVGVEKEYRLSKVAKVSAFMYGEDDIQIIYADALAKNDRLKEGTFDLLVANPPYSVKGFLETLSEEDRARYDLTDCVSDLSKQDAIETFFIERAFQLLKPTGIAAIILPNSILSKGNNKGNVFVKCREIILKSFDIISIVHFEKGTFSKTTTGTVVLFLRKKDAPPDFADHMKNRVDAWFAARHDGDEVFGDSSALERYCIHRNFDSAEYKVFMSGGAPSAVVSLNTTDVFKSYRAAFSKIKKPRFTESEYIRAQEKERLYYFLLADAHASPVLVIKMPTETKAAKTYLGYEWSEAKGNEGIKYIGANSTANDDDDETLSRNKGIESIKTPLFNNADLFDASKLNSLVRLNFSGALSDIPENLKPFAKQIRLVDMLDFDASIFDKQLRTTTLREIRLESRYPLVNLREFASDWLKGQPFTKGDITAKGKNPCIHYGELFKYGIVISEIESRTDRSPTRVSQKGDILFPCSDVTSSGLARCSVIMKDGVLLGGDIIILRPEKRSDFDCRYLAIAICHQREQLLRLITGQNVKHLAAKDLERVKIPLPPLSVQKKVVAECGKVDEEYNTSRMTIEEYRAKIAAIFARLKIVISAKNDGGGYKLVDITRYVTQRINYSAIMPETYISTDNMLQQCEGVVLYDGNPNINSCIAYRKGDVLVSNIRPYLKKSWLADCDGGCSPDVLVFRVLDTTKIIPEYLGAALKQDDFFDFMMQGIKGMKMPRGDKFHTQNYIIPVPSLSEQKCIVAEIAKYESEITKAKAVMDSAPAHKQAILRKYGVIA